ncbi:MAG: nitroreductase family protein [Acidimicrobiales bacterium]|nr:nitroreductase family protein [Acidimicrobiales bacterium]
MVDLYEAMSTLRAVRRLRPDPIPDDVLRRVIQAAAWAPTGGNAQPWHVVVVKDRAVKQGLQAIYEPEWQEYMKIVRTRMAALEGEALAKMQRTAAAGDQLAANLADTPAILMFFADPTRMAITDIDLDRTSIVGGGSVYPAVQNAMLACRAEGLGCVLTTLHCRREPQVLELLNVPQPWMTAAMVPVGYPEGGGHGKITRQAVAELTSVDSFGTPWST